MVFDDFKKKNSVVIVFTGDGKGKTSAGLGLMIRALGNGFKVLFVQFIKDWEVGEHKFISRISKIYDKQLIFYQSGAGFYKAGDLSSNSKDIEHSKKAKDAYRIAFDGVSSGEYDLVICDEINNTAKEGLIDFKDIEELIKVKNEKTNLCLTGRYFPKNLIKYADIATEMTKVKHHYDDKFLANQGIDY